MQIVRKSNIIKIHFQEGWKRFIGFVIPCIDKPRVFIQTVNLWLKLVSCSSLYYRSASTTPSGSPCSSQQSVYNPTSTDPQAIFTAPKPQSSWNPFEDDNFSMLTAEELLNKDFAKLADSKLRFSDLVCWRFIRSLHVSEWFVSVFLRHSFKTRRKDSCCWWKSHSWS